MDGKLRRDSGGLFSRHSFHEDSSVGIVHSLDFSLEAREIASHDTHTVSGSNGQSPDPVVLGEIVREPRGEHSASSVLWGIVE